MLKSVRFIGDCLSLYFLPFQLDGPAGLTSWTDQFSIFETLASSHIRRVTSQFVGCRSFRVRGKPCFFFLVWRSYKIWFEPWWQCYCVCPFVWRLGVSGKRGTLMEERFWPPHAGCSVCVIFYPKTFLERFFRRCHAWQKGWGMTKPFRNHKNCRTMIDSLHHQENIKQNCPDSLYQTCICWIESC